MIGKAKLVIYLVGALSGAGVVAGIWLHGNSHGKRTVEAQYQAAIAQVRREQARMADQLSEVQRERDRLAGQRTRTIYLEPDSSGCADVPALGSVLDGLRRPD